ncbi:MAG: M23 family metallopeptidase [Magnetococcales bacterium]|nr:M23 family metallopeptidase [Magnetococcales bacterium]
MNDTVMLVAYADSGLPGYGNMILVRHGGSYMTAYAHNDTIMVKPGQKVRAGQIIAKVGTSGRVKSPRLHFEVRKSVTAINPLRHLPYTRKAKKRKRKRGRRG